MNFRRLIARRIKDADLSQAEVARRAAMPAPNLHDYLTGRADMTGARIERLLVALGAVAVTWREPSAKKKKGERGK